MIFGLAWGIAVFCVLCVVVALIAIFKYHGEMTIIWSDTLGWAVVFAAGGASIGYIIKGVIL